MRHNVHPSPRLGRGQRQRAAEGGDRPSFSGALCCFQPLLALNPGPGSSTAQPGARPARRRFPPETTQSTYNASPNITPSCIGVSPSVGWHRSAPYFWSITRPKLSKVVREDVSLPIPVAYHRSIPPLMHALFFQRPGLKEHGSTTNFPASRVHPESLRASPSSSHSLTPSKPGASGQGRWDQVVPRTPDKGLSLSLAIDKTRRTYDRTAHSYSPDGGEIPWG